jgi:hypothetical protein
MRRRSFAAALFLAIAIAAPTYATIVNVGGGTWNYGTEQEALWGKHVWSHYVHNTLRHSATAICASQNVKIFANPIAWADADVHCNVWDSAAEYWATY